MLNEHNLYGYDVRVDLNGKAIVKGVVLDQLPISKFSTSIVREIPGLSEVTFNTTKASEVIAWLNHNIEKIGMNGIGASSYREYILVSGKATTLQKHRSTN